MTAASWFQLVAIVGLVAAGARLLGPYLAHVYDGSPSRADRVFGPVERVIYRVCGIDERREQRWNIYALSVLAFSLVSVLALFALMRVQGAL
ncbi:MAG: potassium-transporting ATPase subunit KdpA, partial [Acidimicrobiales bacterium]|nr:potassium-transporting ATPase subunit KdpA [Acidimicrobiales bacterium]